MKLDTSRTRATFLLEFFSSCMGVGRLLSEVYTQGVAALDESVLAIKGEYSNLQSPVGCMIYSAMYAQSFQMQPPLAIKADVVTAFLMQWAWMPKLGAQQRCHALSIWHPIYYFVQTPIRTLGVHELLPLRSQQHLFNGAGFLWGPRLAMVYLLIPHMPLQDVYSLRSTNKCMLCFIRS